MRIKRKKRRKSRSKSISSTAAADLLVAVAVAAVEDVVAADVAVLAEVAAKVFNLVAAVDAEEPKAAVSEDSEAVKPKVAVVAASAAVVDAVEDVATFRTRWTRKVFRNWAALRRLNRGEMNEKKRGEIYFPTATRRCRSMVINFVDRVRVIFTFLSFLVTQPSFSGLRVE